MLLVDKPAGMTSHDVVHAVRSHFRIRKVGHCGTLDPQATGLLMLLTGRATRLSQLLMGSDKTYLGTIRLGTRTSTQDSEGEVLEELPVPELSEDEIKVHMRPFLGDQYQTPPMVSAVKIDGQRLYKLARKGQEVERPQRFIHIYRFDLLEFHRPDELITLVRCTKGTYVRTLAEDLGRALGCGAHLAALRRTNSDPFAVDQAHSLAKLLSAPPEPLGIVPFLIPFHQIRAGLDTIA